MTRPKSMPRPETPQQKVDIAEPPAPRRTGKLFEQAAEQLVAESRGATSKGKTAVDGMQVKGPRDNRADVKDEDAEFALQRALTQFKKSEGR